MRYAPKRVRPYATVGNDYLNKRKCRALLYVWSFSLICTEILGALARKEEGEREDPS